MIHSIRFRGDGDERVVVLVRDKEVFSVNHDEHGWAGMTAVLDAVKAVARELGYKVHDDQDVV